MSFLRVIIAQAFFPDSTEILPGRCNPDFAEIEPRLSVPLTLTSYKM